MVENTAAAMCENCGKSLDEGAVLIRLYFDPQSSAPHSGLSSLNGLRAHAVCSDGCAAQLREAHGYLDPDINLEEG